MRALPQFPWEFAQGGIIRSCKESCLVLIEHTSAVSRAPQVVTRDWQNDASIPCSCALRILLAVVPGEMQEGPSAELRQEDLPPQRFASPQDEKKRKESKENKKVNGIGPEPQTEPSDLRDLGSAQMRSLGSAEHGQEKDKENVRKKQTEARRSWLSRPVFRFVFRRNVCRRYEEPCGAMTGTHQAKDERSFEAHEILVLYI